MSFEFICLTLLALSLAIIVYHHVGYPILLKHFAASRRSAVPDLYAAPASVAGFSKTATLPTITMIVPVYNEAGVIAAKIKNIDSLDYPRDRLTVVIALDGCTDASREIVEKTTSATASGINWKVVEYAENIGKIAVLNDTIANARTDIVALSDASAIIDEDALLKAARHFSDADVGVVCATYRLKDAGSEGERAYWDYQTSIKSDEAALAAPMGAHGAFYLFRRPLWQPIAADTINDDFVLPMQIVLSGSRAIYDPAIVATEIERTGSEQEFKRRVRIGAGNMQQTWRLAGLANPKHGWLAFLFVSGKGLRPLIPFIGIAAVLTSAALAFSDGGVLLWALLIAELLAIGVAVLAIVRRSSRYPKLVSWLGYLVEGHAASFVGAIRLLTGRERRPWTSARVVAAADDDYVPTSVLIAKRGFDVIVAGLALPILSVLFVPIAIAIKLSSPGPVFYRQLRVGRSTSGATQLFELIKFRTMRVDAEAASGPVLAQKNDPRASAVGLFLRKTHLDELPQFWNVLKGDMSVVGPRPERPAFVSKHDVAIPFYSERTFGVAPGITGLAQINIVYDTSLDDVMAKVMYDHVYAAHLTRLGDWIATDLRILLRTTWLVVAGKGH